MELIIFIADGETAGSILRTMLGSWKTGLKGKLRKTEPASSIALKRDAALNAAFFKTTDREEKGKEGHENRRASILHCNCFEKGEGGNIII